MAIIRKLLLLDPSKKLLSDFKTQTEQVIEESEALLESVPKLPVTEVSEEYTIGARDLLNCMVELQEQLNSLKSTYKHMKTYIEDYCVQSHTQSIESSDAYAAMSSRTQFDQKRFKEEHPELYQDYIKQTNPFLVVKRKK
jgi:predicted phage-related endonuclease